ncbi:MAG: hypothetical protein IK088_02385 [Lachnospiraceae bacterium]|nr:hypothetical protein [Lachnospiraceae bacterium]
MGFESLRKEMRSFYGPERDEAAELFCSECAKILDSQYREDMSVFAMKRLQYRVITDRMQPIVFRYNPFYYETGTMAPICDGARTFRGHHHAGGWTYWKNEHFFEDQDPELYHLMKRQKSEKMYLICGPYNDTSQHFCFNHRPVLLTGLKGIYEKAEAAMKDADSHEKDFLLSVMEGMLCLKAISGKFKDRAEEMLKTETDTAVRKNLLRIADAAGRTPWERPKTFYEALNMYAFMRKALGSLEGIGFSSFGRIDMDLYPFYRQDIEAGILTKEEAYELIAEFLLMFDCHYDRDMKFEGYSDHELENTYPVWFPQKPMFLSASQSFRDSIQQKTKRSS